MSTYSTNLKIEEIGTGEQAGTWGVTTNDNFVNVFEQAIVGRVTVSFSNADVTLTATNSVASQSFRNVYLNCTGTNAASRNLIVPTINKNYVVQNNTTGGFDIVVKTTAGTGITVPNGRTCTVYADGTNVIQAFDYLPVATVGTLTITSISTTNLSVSGVATFAAGTVSAPAITTTGDTNTGIFFPAADTIAFTEGGVESMRIDSSGNLLVGTATASTKLTVNLTSANDGITLRTTANGAIGLFGMVNPGTNNDIQSGTLGNNNFIFFTNGTANERMRITGTGNVGIGTNNPARLFQVSSAGDTLVRIVGGAANARGVEFYDSSSNGSQIYSVGSDIRFFTVASASSTERMRLDASGNLGLGVTPSPWLSTFRALQIGVGTVLYNNTNANGTFLGSNFYWNGTNNIYIGSNTATSYAQTGGQHQWFNAASGTAGNPITFTQAMTLNASGNLGIGVTTVGSRLDVRGSNVALASDGIARVSVDSNGADTGGQITFANSDARRAAIAGRQEASAALAGYLQFGTRGTSGDITERMRITSTGDVGIGASATNRLNLTYDGGTGLANIGPNSTGGGTLLAFGTSNAGTYGERMRITGAGDVGIGTSVPSYKLDVIGQASRLGSGTTGSVFGLTTNTGGSLLFGVDQSGGGSLAGGSSAYAGVLNHTGAYSLQFGTNNTIRATIDSSGNVGINTSAPQGKFQVLNEGSLGSDTDSNTSNTMIVGANKNASSNQGNLFIYSNSTATDGFGGSIGFGGFYTGSTVAAFGRIAGVRTGGSFTGALTFYTRESGGTMPERMRIDSSGNVFVAKTSSSAISTGCEFQSGTGGNAAAIFTASGGIPIIVNRQAEDGTLVSLRQANTEEGSISVSGTTVSYNGGHLSRWSQLPDGSKDDTIIKGTVMSNLDNMCVWEKDGVFAENEQLNKMKVSDVEGDTNVAGVFVNWTIDEQYGVDDMNVAMTGDMIIRIADGVVVQKGDLLMSAGDGTAKPQGDDIVRSKTIAKVTSNYVTCTYADGSYCVPCVLMAC